MVHAVHLFLLQDGFAAAAAQKRRFADGLATELAAVRQAAAPLRGSLQVNFMKLKLP